MQSIFTISAWHEAGKNEKDLVSSSCLMRGTSGLLSIDACTGTEQCLLLKQKYRTSTF